MDIKKFFLLLDFDAHISFGIRQGEKPPRQHLRLDDFAEFVVPEDIEERWKATPELNRMDSVGQYKLLLKLILEKATGEW